MMAGAASPLEGAEGLCCFAASPTYHGTACGLPSPDAAADECAEVVRITSPLTASTAACLSGTRAQGPPRPAPGTQGQPRLLLTTHYALLSTHHSPLTATPVCRHNQWWRVQQRGEQRGEREAAAPRHVDGTCRGRESAGVHPRLALTLPHAFASPFTVAEPQCKTAARAERSHAPLVQVRYMEREGMALVCNEYNGTVVSVDLARGLRISFEGLRREWVNEHGQSAPWAVPEVGSRASSGRAWAALAGSALPGERPAHWTPSHCTSGVRGSRLQSC